MTDDELREKVAGIVAGRPVHLKCDCDRCLPHVLKADRIIALVRADAFKEAAGLIESQPDNGISYQSLWRVAGLVRALAPTKEARP